MRRLLIVPALLLSLVLPAAAQFNNIHPEGVPMPTSADVVASQRVGGPVAIGQAQLQKDDGGKVALISAPAPPSGGLIQFSAFGWLEPYVDSAANALILALVGYMATVLKTKWNIDLDQGHRNALTTFLQNRAASLISDGAVRMSGKSVQVDNAMLARAANQASLAIPGVLKRFGLTPDVVAAKIIDAIPQTTAGAAIIADAHKDSPEPPVTVTDRPIVPSANAAPSFLVPPTAPLTAA
jgi:hypothetical protein